MDDDPVAVFEEGHGDIHTFPRDTYGATMTLDPTSLNRDHANRSSVVIEPLPNFDVLSTTTTRYYVRFVL